MKKTVYISCMLLAGLLCRADEPVVLVLDPFTDGGVTQGADPYDVNWNNSDNTTVELTVVEDSFLDPESPHYVADFLIGNPVAQEKDDYINFSLPSNIVLEVGQALQVSHRLRFYGGVPRSDASRTGISLAYRESGTSPWGATGNREYFFMTSFGSAGTLGSIRRSEDAQFLNVGDELAGGTASVNLSTNTVGTVFFEVARLEEDGMRIRYRLNNGPIQEAFDHNATNATYRTFNRVYWRYRRATTEPLESMRLDDVKVVLTTADTNVPPPQVWYVSPSGNDEHDGMSTNTPFRTLGTASQWARAGDTVWVMEGRYREQLVPLASGETDRPIKYAALVEDDSPHEVVVSGFDIIHPGQDGMGEWAVHAGEIWKIQLPAGWGMTLGRNLIKVDGVPLLPARWPTAQAPVDFDRRGMAEAVAGGLDIDSIGPQPPYSQSDYYSAFYLDPALSNFNQNVWAGAHIDLCAGHNWWWKSGVVTSNSGDRLDFRFRFSDGWNHVLDTPKHNDRYALWGHISALDSPGEFFLDVNGINGPSRTLYVWLPQNAAPHDHEVSILNRQESLSLTSRSHLIFENLTFDGGVITMHADSASNRFDGITSVYATMNRNNLIYGSGIAVDLRGTGHQFVNGYVSRAFGSGIGVAGNGMLVENCVVHDCASHLLSLAGGRDSRFANNTIFRTGTTAIDFGGKSLLIESNHVYFAGLRITDIAAVNVWNCGDLEETELRYNWVHDNLAPRDGSLSWWGGQGIRLDSGGAPLGCSNVKIHHNVVWNTTADSSITAWGLEEGMTNYGDSKIRAYHNTVDRFLVFGGSGSVEGCDYRRNIAQRFNNAVGNTAGAVLEENLFLENAPEGNLTGNPGYASPVNRNYTLRPESIARDVGTPIAGITEPSGGAYLGAYNPNAEPWRPGARLREGDVAHLDVTAETDDFGQTRVHVAGLPAGRTFPDAFAVRLHDRVSTNMLVRYSINEHRASGLFELDFAGLEGDVNFAVSFDGETWLIPAQSSVVVALPVLESLTGLIAPPEGGSVHSLSGAGFFGNTAIRVPLSFAGLTGNDLKTEAIPWIVDTSGWVADGMLPDGADLRVYNWDGISPVRHYVESGLGQTNTLIWLMHDGTEEQDTDVISFDDRTTLYLSYGDPSRMSTDDPELLTDSFPALGFTNILLHVRANKLAATHAENDAVEAWPDLSPADNPVVQSAADARPVYRAGSMGGLPALQFDGIDDHLDVNGSAGLGSGPGRFLVVFRNPDPGTVKWQRLYSARTDTDMQDYVDGHYAIVPNVDGVATTNIVPMLNDMNRPGEYSRLNFCIGRRSLSDAEPFRGEIAEMIGFEGEFAGQARDELLSYLRRKYGMVERPFAALEPAAAIPSVIVLVGGVEATGVALMPDGTIRFDAPEYNGELPATMDVVLRLPGQPDLVMENAFTYAIGGDSGDQDGDGIPNEWELRYFGGVTNAPQNLTRRGHLVVPTYHVYLWGVDPLDDDAVLEIVGLRLAQGPEPTELSFSFPAVSNRLYDVLATTNLLDHTGWDAIGENLQSLDDVIEITDTDGLPQRFYRIRVKLPE